MVTSVTRRPTSFQPFFRLLARSRKSVLLLDYDGTLAPFRPERDSAVPYPGIPRLLEKILSCTDTRMVVVSGRAAREIPSLLGARLPLEIWGSHGMERLLPNGSYRVNKLDSRVATALAKAADALEASGLSDRIEMKPGGLAVHWRGLDAAMVAEAYTLALRVMQPVAFSAGFAILNFDGGIEMRVRMPNKGDVVRTIIKEQGGAAPIAYLGDDVTDEEAFTALNPFGVTVLVRQQYRSSSAQFWICPPDELTSFLEDWLRACGGEYDFE
jgi:trehalose 6-phosphate phosphatase